MKNKFLLTAIVFVLFFSSTVQAKNESVSLGANQEHRDRYLENIKLLTETIYQNKKPIKRETYEFALSNMEYAEKPSRGPYEKIRNLTKGEFETTVAFNKRVIEEKKRVSIANSQNDKYYNELFNEWKTKDETQNKKYQKQLKYYKDNKDIIYSESITEAVGRICGRTKIKNIKYDADYEVFNISINLEKCDFIYNFKQPVGSDIAKKYKIILTGLDFNPKVFFEFSEEKLSVNSFQELQNPIIMVKNEELYEKSKNSISKLLEFIANIDENSRLLPKAKSQLSRLYSYDYERIAKKEREKAQQEREERLRNAHYAKKYPGDQVCMDGTTAFILSITIKAYVESVNGDNMQLRIADTEGTSPHYKGVTLYGGKVIWDKYYNWKHCN